jgi:pimeloyl-ACP methyl ester carboxylesterase
MPFTTRDSVSLYYERDQGGKERGTVVFVEGLGVGRWLWHWQREAFADAYDLLLPDNRGSGESDAPLPPVVPRLPQALRVLWFLKIGGYSIEEMAADLEAVLADAGVERAHVVGASMGGMIAQQYALEYDRAESLCLLCTTHGGEDAVPIPDETQAQIYDTPEDATERERIRHRMGPALTDRFVAENPETIEQILDWREEQDADEVPREAQGAAGANFDVSDHVGSIDLPTLVLHGTDDRVLPVENGRRIAEKLPDARLEILEGAPHMLMIERSKEVNELLEAFLAKQG